MLAAYLGSQLCMVLLAHTVNVYSQRIEIYIIASVRDPPIMSAYLVTERIEHNANTIGNM